jgi:hypothetical protein
MSVENPDTTPPDEGIPNSEGAESTSRELHFTSDGKAIREAPTRSDESDIPPAVRNRRTEPIEPKEKYL